MNTVIFGAVQGKNRDRLRVQPRRGVTRAYMLNTPGKERSIVFYAYLACSMDTVTFGAAQGQNRDRLRVQPRRGVTRAYVLSDTSLC